MKNNVYLVGIAMVCFGCSSDGPGHSMYDNFGGSTQLAGGSSVGGSAVESVGGSLAGMSMGGEDAGIEAGGSAVGGSFGGTAESAMGGSFGGTAGSDGGSVNSGGFSGSIGGSVSGSGGSVGGSSGSGGAPTVTFTQVASLIGLKCQGGCHGGGTNRNLNFNVSNTTLFATLTTQIPTSVLHCESGTTLAIGGNVAHSFLVSIVNGPFNCSDVNAQAYLVDKMPKGCSGTGSSACLTSDQIELISNWVSEGAMQN